MEKEKKAKWIVIHSPALLIALIVNQFFIISANADVFLWPIPQSISWGAGPPITISSHLRITFPRHRDLHRAVVYYRKLMLSEKWLPVQVSAKPTSPTATVAAANYSLTWLQIKVRDISADLQHGVDESYSLNVPDQGSRAKLEAMTVWGVIRGLETLTQLIRMPSGKSKGEPIIEHGVSIHDKPKFAHRGLLLDTSRNFYAVNDILRTIRALGHNKMNVFHWHITDSQSFPLSLASEPLLAAKGSYGEGFIYSNKDVAKIVRYGRTFGVRVIPEIDAPGHTASWAAAYPEIVVCNNQFWVPPGVDRFANEPTPGQLNPLNPKTYEVFKNVVDDVASMFPDTFFHAGADEIILGCWKNSTDIQKFLKENHTMDEILTRFINTSRSFFTSHNKTTVYWADVITSTEAKVDPTLLPPSSTILQNWNGGSEKTKSLVQKGYRVIASDVDWFYLDCGFGNWLSNNTNLDQDFNNDPNNTYNWAPQGKGAGTGGSWCAPFKSWSRIYDHDITAGMTSEEAKLVIGGEVCLWSEQSDGVVVDSRLWPRTAALGESMWSGNRNEEGRKRSGEATDRMNDWRFRLLRRGIGAEPLQPLWCLKHSHQCDFEQTF
ncbi:hypothetical protein O6H91_03G060200 [Diphasiastrum complanatum]|uniref:Uncharacterized protein n=1 Tax=Diphasiastrum complanatum TaxID=34168 RepID=A0ACC2E6W3_DIPCM|nr:hypothetical protein O6H91_03G060200 [Diphasiastrum complanatum]